MTGTPAKDEQVADDEQIEYVHEHIHNALYDGLDARWDEVLLEWDAASASQRKVVKTHLSGIRNRVWNQLSQIRSLEGLEKGLAIQYVELKSRWATLNAQIQSQTTKEDAPEDALVYRATGVSFIIQSLEPLLRREHVDRLVGRLNESVQ